jgi:hypothetical protein
MSIKDSGMFLPEKGTLSPEQICDLIVAGDDASIDNFLNTIRSTIDATSSSRHVEAVKKLHMRCQIVSRLLHGIEFKRRNEVDDALTELNEYATVGVTKKIH